MAKRTNTANWREDKNMWQINVQKDGKRKSFYSSTPGKKGQRECNAKADAWLDDDIDNQTAKVSTMYPKYVEELKLRTSRSHWRMEESRYNTWYKDQIGELKISKLNDKHLQDIINRAYSEGKLSKKSLQGLRASLVAFIKYCRKQKATTYTPEDIIIPRAAVTTKKRILQPQDIKVLFTVDTTILRNKRVYDEFINAYRFQVMHGLRPGELLGLKFSDINGDILHINRSINIYGEETTGKNQNALRPIALNEMSLQIIEKQKQHGYNDFIFGEVKEDSYRKRWQKYCESNGIEYISLYELRHTFVSVAKNLSMGQLKQVVGHSASMDTYGTYSHAIKGELKKTANEIHELFIEIIEDTNDQN